MGTGIMNLVWLDFEPAEEPIQAFGDHIPGREIFACVTALCLIAGGAAIFWPRAARFGTVVVAVVYCIFTVFWMPRLYTAPRILGFHLPVYIGVLGGLCQQLILVAAALVIYASGLPRGTQLSNTMTTVARWVFGLSSMDFGLSHLTGVAATARLVPSWIPFGQDFWVILTGTAFVLAGVAICLQTLDVLASRLLALMLVIFSALALAPLIVKYPHNHSSWGVNIYNLAAIGAVWIFAEWLAARQRGGFGRSR